MVLVGSAPPMASASTTTAEGQAAEGGGGDWTSLHYFPWYAGEASRDTAAKMLGGELVD